MDKVYFFRRTVKELSLKVNIMEDIVIRQDNRLGRYSACITLYQYCDSATPVYLMRFNGRRIEECSQAEIVNIILHELGHIKHQHEFENKKPMWKMELEAEQFAVENVKKYYPEYYSIIIRNLKAYKYHDDPLYKTAFTKLLRKLHEK